MKRLILRIGALVTLVGVGVIAIAQAQRSSSPQPADDPVAAPLTAARTPPKLLPDLPQSARPIADLAKLRLPATRLGSVSEISAVATAAAADPFPQQTSHVVRAVGTTSQPILVKDDTAPAATIKADINEPAKTNPLREPTLAVTVAPAATAPPPAAPSEPRLVPTLARAAADPEPPTSPARTVTQPSAPQADSPASVPQRLAPISEALPTQPAPPFEPRKSVDIPAPFASTGSDTREPARLRTDTAASPSRMLPASRDIPDARDSLSAASVEGTGQPGQKQLEGPQTPQLTIQKFAPEAVQVGAPATFRITVINTGPVPAHGVEVRDQVPRGMQLVNSKPRVSRATGAELVWELGTVKPGDEVIVETQLMPVAQGELGSVATVRFNAEASARTVATKPELTLKSTVPKKIMIGEETTLAIEVSNPGTGVATGVVLTETVPAGLQHQAGTELEYKIGTLKPGETRQIQLSMTAAKAGAFINLLTAEGEANLKAEDRTNLEVIAPAIDIAMEGPKRRFLEREATYTVSVVNNGTAAARQVELVAYLPRGLKFVSASNAGQYDAATQSVHWLLTELPANDAGKVELVTLPVEVGQQKVRLLGKAERAESVEKEHPVTVEGIAAIMFEVVDLQDPIEKGGETTYEIRVVNQGSKAATNVRVTALLPPGMKALSAEGPTRYTLETNRVQFEGLARLAPKAESTYRVRAQGLQPGDLRIRVQLLTDEMQEPVTKEESTRVYTDE